MPITRQNMRTDVAMNSVSDPFPGVEARPLQMPDFINIKPKNPLLSFRFVNRIAGEGQRLDQMTYAGFVPVKPEECVMANGSPLSPSLVKDGKVIFGDLICMKIPKTQYEGALKYNWSRAVDRMHPSAAVKTGKKELSKSLSEAGAGRVPDLQKKLSVFQPSSKEVQDSERAEDGE